MKLPKYWNNTNAASDGLAPGVSKSNSLEIVNAPFLTASGPGFTTYKKDGFTNIVLGGGYAGPFMWGITSSGPYEVMSIGDPSNGKAINTGVQHYATNLGIRVGGGKILAVARDEASTSWPLLVDVNQDSFPKVVSYAESLPMMRDQTNPPSGYTSLAAMFATGRDKNHSGGYRWGVARLGYFAPPEMIPVPDPGWNSETRVYFYKKFTIFQQTWLDRDMDGHIFSRSQDAYLHERTVETVTGTYDHGTFKLSHFPSFTVYLGDTVTPKKGEQPWTKEVTLVDGQSIDRKYDIAGPFCIGPGKLAALVVPTDAVYIPGTSWQTEEYFDNGYWVHQDIHGTYWGGNVELPVHFPLDWIHAGTYGYERREHHNYLPPIPPYLMVSEDHGETWSPKNLEGVIGVDLYRAPGVDTHVFDDAIGNQMATVVHSEYYDGYDPVQLTLLARGFYMCYIGEGKAIALVPALVRRLFTPGVPVSGTINPVTDQVACFLVDTKTLTSERVAWPGDDPTDGAWIGNTLSVTTHVDMSKSGNVGKSISGCFGVGCFMIVGRQNYSISTRDFGKTWTTTGTDLPGEAFTDSISYSLPLALWPTTIRPYKTTKNQDGTTTVSKGMVAFAYPGNGVFLTYTDGLFTEYWNFGHLYTAAPKDPGGLPLYRPNYYALYYGHPGSRGSPRPELGNEFDKVTP